MKKSIFFLALSLFLCQYTWAQTGGINFQGLARNASGEVLVNQKITLRFSVLMNSDTGTTEYQESKEATTNAQGMFSLVIGEGSILTKTGNFSDINWKVSPKFLKVEMDPSAGTNFTLMGTSKLQAVPFAYYANGVDAENVQGVLPAVKGGTGVASISALKGALQLDQVSNTSDANKPLSTATQTALATKVDKVQGKELSTNDYTTEEKTKLAAITGTNTGDQDLSGFATNTVLATKANTSDVTTALATKVDKVEGKSLSTNDYTTAEKTKLAAITGTNTGDQDLSGLATTTALATKANSTEVAAALATKVDKVQGKDLSTNDYTTAEKTKLAAITGTNTGDQDLSGFATTADLNSKANAADVTTALATKVDKVQGKDLSTNDYTTAEKTKLAAISGTNTGDQDLSSYATTADLASKASITSVTTSLNLKEDVANKSTQTDLGGQSTSDVLYPSQKAVKTYVDTQINNGGIADGSITSQKIADGTLTNADINSSAAIAYGKLDLSGSIVASDISSTTAIPFSKLAISKSDVMGLGIPGSDTNTTYSAGSGLTLSGTTFSVGSGAITSTEIAGGAITGEKIGISAVDLGTKITGILPTSNGGTGINSATSNTIFAGPNGFAGAPSFRQLMAADIPLNLTGYIQNTPSTAQAASIAISGSIVAGGIQNTPIGNSSPNTGAFTNLTVAGNEFIGGALEVGGTATFFGTTTFTTAQSSKALFTNQNKEIVSNSITGTENVVMSKSPVLTGTVTMDTLNVSQDIVVNGLKVGRGGGNILTNLTFGANALALNSSGVGNVAIGFEVLKNNTLGNFNTGVGYQVLFNNSTGINNLGVGDRALYANTIGSNNIGIGSLSLVRNIEGDNNIALGFESLPFNTSGTSNVALGFRSLYSNATGNNNLAIGYGSLLSNTTGSNNFASGYESLLLNTTGSNNFASGIQSLRSNTTGNYNVAIGYASLLTNSSGNNNAAIGTEGLRFNTSGESNVAIGFLSLRANTVGNNNLAVGERSLVRNTEGNNNIALGFESLPFNTSGNSNVALGHRSLYSNATGNNNLAIGYESLFYNTTGIDNTALGLNSLKANTTGSHNLAIGSGSLQSNTTGPYNTAIGLNSLRSNTEGYQNTAIGVQSLYSNTTGVNNFAVGAGSLYENTTGNENTAIGFNSLNLNSTGSFNIAIGAGSGRTLTIGNNNIFLGWEALPSSATASNQIVLGNSSITSLRAQVTSITALSDRRDKRDIVTLKEGIDFIKQLKPVTFTWDTRDKAKVGIKSAGFIAQDLLALQKASAIGDNLDLVSEDNPEKLEARYANLLPVMVKAMQEQQAIIEQLKLEIEALKKQVKE